MKKENKRKFNIFVSILTCFIITLACLSPSFISRADGVLNNVEALGISEDTFKRSDFEYSSNGIAENDTWLTYYDNCYANNFQATSLYNSEWQPFVENNDLTKYYCYFDTVESLVMLGAMTEDSFIVCNNNYFRVYTELYIEPDHVYYNNGHELAFKPQGNNYSQYAWQYNQTQNVDGTKYIYREYQNLLSSNLPMYFINSYGWDFDSLDDLQDMKNPIASNGISTEDIKSNNYLGYNNSILMEASNLENGVWKVFLDWNFNQINEGLDNYNVNVTFNLIGNTTFQGNGDYEDICVDTYGLTKANGVYNLSKTFSYSTTIKGSSSDNGLYTFDFSKLNDGLKSGGKTVIPMVQLFDKHRGTNDVHSGTANLVSRLLNDTAIGPFSFKIPLFSTDDTSVQFNSLSYTCSVDVTDSNGKSILKQPLYQPYDMLTGARGEFINGGVDYSEVESAISGDTSLNPSGYQPTIVKGDGNTNSATASSGGAGGNSNSNSNIESGAVVINNNPTFNNDSSSSSASFGTGGLIPFIIGAIAGNKKSSSDSITSLTGANGWLQVISSTWQWIPAQIWTVLLTTFQAVIGICVVAFIISIIIRFIT